MNEKKLQQKLEKKTQQIIDGATCIICDKPVVYILTGHGCAGKELEYMECDIPSMTFFTQDGKSYFGYKLHKCNKV